MGPEPEHVQGRLPGEGGDEVLTAARIEEFIERGYLVLRNCLPATRLRELARSTLVDKVPMPTYRGRGGQQDALAHVDLLDASTWPSPNLYIDTQRSLPIAELAPELWTVLRTLVGDKHYIDRRTMGEQLILNGDRRPPPAPPLTPEYRGEWYWHIDEPSPTTTLHGRRDALVLLILWSKVEPGGGGTLFSGESLDRVVRQLDASPDGVDTADRGWGTAIARECDDAFELSGEVGDVLVSHAFALHAAHANYRGDLRVLENPTITVRGALDYSLDNPDPSPVEACVIRRRARRATRSTHPKTALRAGAEALRRRHADFFLPGRGAWRARADARTQARVFALDAGLWAAWTRRVTELIELRARGQGARAGLEIALAIVREVFANELHCGVRVAESIDDPDFEQTAWARLVRGMVNADGQSFALATILARMGMRVELFRLPGPGHLLTRVVTSEGWAFADAWAGSSFFVASVGGDAIPGVPEHAELIASGRSTSARFGRGDYEEGRGIAFATPPDSHPDLAALARAIDAGSGRARPPEADVWSSFISARIDQLLGDRAAAHRGYLELLRRLDPSTTTAKIAEVFERRTGAEHYALDF